MFREGSHTQKWPACIFIRLVWHMKLCEHTLSCGPQLLSASQTSRFPSLTWPVKQVIISIGYMCAEVCLLLLIIVTLTRERLCVYSAACFVWIIMFFPWIITTPYTQIFSEAFRERKWPGENMERLNFALGDSASFLDFCWEPWGLFDPCDSLSGIARSQGCCEYFPPGPLGNLHPGNPSSLNETTVPKQERRLTLLRNEIAMQSNEKINPYLHLHSV